MRRVEDGTNRTKRKAIGKRSYYEIEVKKVTKRIILNQGDIDPKPHIIKGISKRIVSICKTRLGLKVKISKN